MLDTIITPLTHFVTWLISTLGYAGVALAMGIESACIPLPSEIIMPFSGYLAAQGTFSLIGVVLAGTLGGTLGSILTYALGYFGGEEYVRHLIKKYGKYLLIHISELDHALHWFSKYGNLITFTSRLLPVVRTFISLPAGIAKMSFHTFVLYAALGSFIWSYFLGYVGYVMGENWHTLGGYFHKFDLAIVALAVVTVVWYITHKLAKFKEDTSHSKPSH